MLPASALGVFVSILVPQNLNRDYSERNCRSTSSASVRSQCSANFPFSTRQMSIVLYVKRFPVGGIPRNAWTCVAVWVARATTLDVKISVNLRFLSAALFQWLGNALQHEVRRHVIRRAAAVSGYDDKLSRAGRYNALATKSASLASCLFREANGDRLAVP